MELITSFFVFIKPLVTVGHVLTVISGMGAAIMADILFSFYAKNKKLSRMELNTLDILAKIVKLSLYVIVLTGIALFLSDIQNYAVSAKFLSKMSILAILIVNGFVLNAHVWPHLQGKGSSNFFTSRKEKNTRQLAFVSGAISVVSWIATASLGVTDSLSYTYQAVMGLYFAFMLVAIAISLMVENFELESKRNT
jgi:hypothetical protein